MGATPSVPQIPDIQTAQAPAPSQALDNTLGQVARMATSPLPPMYSQGTQVAQPTLPQVRQAPVLNQNVQPISMQVQDLKRARTQNAVAGLANVINRGAEQIQQRKQDALKTRLVDVMQAKQNVANAQAVLQQDPNNKMAQGVMAANKKRLNDILSDPKHSKEMQKALDISFVDPDKNKTPEVQAFQQAHKEVQQAGAFNASNPAEAAVAKQAAARPSGPNVPGAAPPQGAPAQAVPAAQVHAGPPNPNQPPPQQRSATPYADQALARDMPTMQVNPQYSAALAQQQAAQKALYTNILPAAIRAESAKQIEDIRQNHGDARAQFTALVNLQKQQTADIAKMDQINQAGKLRMQETLRRDSDAMARMQVDVNSRLKIASDRLQDPKQKLNVQNQALSMVDRQLSSITSERANLTNQLANAKTPEEQATIKANLDYNAKKLKYTNDYRQQVASKIFGTDTSKDITPQAPAATPEDKTHVLGVPVGIFGIGPENAGSSDLRSTTPTVEVGADSSDETDTSESSDSDSDDYGNSNP